MENLEEIGKPESVFLDYFMNSFTANSTPDTPPSIRSISWWRERSPNLLREHWFLSAIGYQIRKKIAEPNALLVVDFFETDIYSPGFIEAISLEEPILWICWSNSLLEDWQQEGIGPAAEKKEKLLAYFHLLGLTTFVVPVVDPQAAATAAKRMQIAGSLGKSILVLPAFGNDKLVLANWKMKMLAKFQEVKE